MRQSWARLATVGTVAAIANVHAKCWVLDDSGNITESEAAVDRSAAASFR
jgi:hypothetical protein